MEFTLTTPQGKQRTGFKVNSYTVYEDRVVYQCCWCNDDSSMEAFTHTITTEDDGTFVSNLQAGSTELTKIATMLSVEGSTE